MGAPIKLSADRPLCQNLAIIYSMACNARCEHCIVSSAPESRAKLGVEKSLECIAAAARFGVRVIGLSGGEPTFYLDDILEVMRRGRELYGVSFAMTSNGAWASSEARASEVVAELADAGLEHLRLSADAYHQKYIPLERVTRAVEASLARGIRTRVEVVISRSHGENARIWRHFRKYPVKLNALPLVPHGRAANGFAGKDFLTFPAQSVRVQSCPQAAQIVIDQNGEAWRCCSYPKKESYSAAEKKACPFWLGSIHEEPIERIFERNERSVLCRVLRGEGVAGILRAVSHYLPQASIPLRDRYYDMCDLCEEVVVGDGSSALVREALLRLEADLCDTPEVGSTEVNRSGRTRP